MNEQPLLAALLDTIIPPDADRPGAGGLGLAQQVLTDAEGSAFIDGFHRLLAALPERFDQVEPTTREAVLRRIEDADPAAVADTVNLAYTAYYTNADVLAAVERQTGYHAEPPQPRGYHLAPFDPTRLTSRTQTTTTWRRT